MRIVALLTLCLFFACQPEDHTPIGRYRAAVAEGLETESRPRETLLGLRTGVPAQEYFDKCTELNRQQIITSSGGANMIVHQMPRDLNAPATLTLRPIMTPGARGNDRRVEALEAWFSYDSWAPWARRFYADSLLPHAADHVARTLDLDLIEMTHPRHGRTYAAVDGNRLTALWADDESRVKAMFVDLALQPGDPLELLNAK